MRKWCERSNNAINIDNANGHWMHKDDRTIHADEPELIEIHRARYKLPRRARCSKCKKLLYIRYNFCHDFYCVHAYLPPHKTKSKKKKKPKQGNRKYGAGVRLHK